jgi:hypothetical protein
MKKVFLVLGVVITFMAATMISGWAQKVIDNETYKVNFFVGGGEGATKQPIYLGEIKDAGFMVGGSEGAVKPGINLGEIKDAGFMVGGGEGAVKPGIKWPEQK